MSLKPERHNIFEAYFSKISKLILPFFLKTSFTPNHITFISGIFGVFGAFLILIENNIINIIAGIFIQIFAVLDLVDGDIARAKNLQSKSGMWFDIFFDKTNDFLIILCFTLGAYQVDQDPKMLFLGICLMGINFYIQFIMVLNDHLFKSNRTPNELLTSNKAKSEFSIKYFIGNLIIFYRAHISLQHSQFLVIISIFLVFNQLEFGLYFITIHGLISLLLSIIINFIKIKN
jgi:phosphatidylglycerophosphate synthase